MRHSVVALAALAAVAVSGSLMTTGAQALPLSAPSALQDAAADLNPATEVRYVCRYVRTRHGARRVCSWQRPVRYYAPRSRSRGPVVRFRF